MAEVVITRYRRGKLSLRLGRYLKIRGALAILERESGVSRQSVYRVLDNHLIYKETADKLESTLDRFMVPPYTASYRDNESFDLYDKEYARQDRLKAERERKKKVRFFKMNP